MKPKYPAKKLIGRRHKQLSVSQLLGFAFREPDIANARYVSITSSKNTGGEYVRLQCKTVTHEPNQKPRTHIQSIRPIANLYSGKLTASPGVFILCDCERFTYMWEYALWHHGAVERIVYGNGEPPVQTNPRLWPAPCKHLFKILARIKQKQM